MADLNEVRLIGRLTVEPELRNIRGLSVAKISLATDHKIKRSDGNFDKETTFIEISVFGKTAEAVSKYCAKGKTIYVGGRLKLEQWADKQTGQNRQKLLVIADNVQFLDRKDKDNPEPPWDDPF